MIICIYEVGGKAVFLTTAFLPAIRLVEDEEVAFVPLGSSAARRLELGPEDARPKEIVSFSTFPVFVLSLSWQIFLGISVPKMPKMAKRRFRTKRP